MSENQQKEEITEDFEEDQESQQQSGDEESEEEMTPQEAEIFEAIHPGNINEFLAKATAHKIANEFDQACMIANLIIRRVSGLLENDLHPDLATAYYFLGDTLLEKVENNSDMLGGGIADEQKKQDITEDNDDQEADPQANPNQEEQDDVEIAWENLDVARIIIEKRLTDPEVKDEERSMLQKKQAFVYLRLGACAAWQDQFKQAVEEYTHCLALQRHIYDSSRSREVAETLYTIGNTLTYMDEGECQELNLSPETFFIEAAKVFENLILDEYEKLGTPKNSLSTDINDLRIGIAATDSCDSEKLIELKSLFLLMADKVDECKQNNEYRELMRMEKEREEELIKTNESVAGVDAFGQPLKATAPTTAPAKFLGSFGGGAKKNSAPSELGKREPQEDNLEDPNSKNN